MTNLTQYLKCWDISIIWWLPGILEQGFPGGSDGKESACNVGDLGSVSWLRRSPGSWQPTPVFLPGEFHGQRSPVAYSLWGHKESDMAERLTHAKYFRYILLIIL